MALHRVQDQKRTHRAVRWIGAKHRRGSSIGPSARVADPSGMPCRDHQGCPWFTNRRHHRPIPHPFRFDAAGASTSRRPTTRSWGTAPKVSQRRLPDSAAAIHVGVIGTCRALRSMSVCWMNGRRDVELPKRSKSLAQNRASGDGEREELLLEYVRVWRVAMAAESAVHERQNAGRFAANTWLRQKRTP